MMAVYELYGELFTKVEAFLQALAHEYKIGDSDYVLSKLDEYGFDLTDLGVHPI